MEEERRRRLDARRGGSIQDRERGKALLTCSWSFSALRRLTCARDVSSSSSSSSALPKLKKHVAGGWRERLSASTGAAERAAST